MTRRVRSERPPRLDGAGFTLIELLVVIAIVARTVDDLLALHREAPSSVRAYLDGPGVGDGVLLLIDRNGDDLIDLLELYEYPGAYARKVDGIDKAAGEPLQRFLELVAWELKLGLLTKAGAPEPARAQEPRAHERCALHAGGRVFADARTRQRRTAGRSALRDGARGTRDAGH